MDYKLFKCILWDWNGTLLDDLWLGVEVLNVMLKRRGLPGVTQEQYLNVFDFPVIDYYSRVGFDLEKEAFGDIADEYVELYYGRVYECKLRDGAKEILKKNNDRGVRQAILSATEDQALKTVVSRFGINHYFADIRGIRNHYAESKVEIGKQMLRDMKTDPGEVLIIGDTTHDLEVADQIGAHCILLTGGHQSQMKLASTKAKIANLNTIFN